MQIPRKWQAISARNEPPKNRYLFPKLQKLLCESLKVEATTTLDHIDLSVNNIVDLPSKSENCVLSFLRSRYLNTFHYTWAGRTLLAIRPYLNVKNDESHQLVEADKSTSTPSIYNVVSHALFRLKLQLGKGNQSIVISGESGSGKTFSARLVLKSVAQMYASRSDVKLLLDEAWSCVPLLTAFGNATTSRNDSSSRFGQLLQLEFSNESELVGVQVRTYLLEKSRVSGPNAGEGNFHIFQQLLSNESAETLNSLRLSKSLRYKICGTSELDKSITYKDTLEAFQNLKILQKTDIYKVLSAILNLGNVCFDDLNGNFVVTDDSLVYIENVSNLLEVDAEDLTKLFTTRLISVTLINRRASIYNSPCLNESECQNRRDCLMRFLYEKLFLWLVKTINSRLNKSSASTKFLGVLDVYGFEVFDLNLFEQLCINYANEKLQSYFAQNYFLDEETEVLNGSKINEEFQTRLKLFDDRISLFGVLNEVCSMKGIESEDLLLRRFETELKQHPDIVLSANDFKSFTIVHYAGPVKYHVNQMIAKNRDKVPKELQVFLSEKCKFEFLEKIMQDVYAQSAGQTILSKFKKSLEELTSTLDQTEVHYIKCIKPNGARITNLVDDEYFRNQLYANGIFDILKLAFQGYTIKLPIRYYGRYFRKILSLILEESGLKIHCGAKFVYMNENEFILLEKMHDFLQFFAAIKIQRCFRRAFYQAKNCSVPKPADKKPETFKRKLHLAENIATYAAIPTRRIIFHTSKTCITNSHFLPQHELAKGLLDLLQ